MFTQVHARLTFFLEGKRGKYQILIKAAHPHQGESMQKNFALSRIAPSRSKPVADIPGLWVLFSSFHSQDSEYQGHMKEVANLVSVGNFLYQDTHDWHLLTAGLPVHRVTCDRSTWFLGIISTLIITAVFPFFGFKNLGRLWNALPSTYKCTRIVFCAHSAMPVAWHDFPGALGEISLPSRLPYVARENNDRR